MNSPSDKKNEFDMESAEKAALKQFGSFGIAQSGFHHGAKWQFEKDQAEIAKLKSCLFQAQNAGIDLAAQLKERKDEYDRWIKYAKNWESIDSMLGKIQSLQAEIAKLKSDLVFWKSDSERLEARLNELENLQIETYDKCVVLQADLAVAKEALAEISSLNSEGGLVWARQAMAKFASDALAKLEGK